MPDMPVFNDLSRAKEFYERYDYSEEFPTLASAQKASGIEEKSDALTLYELAEKDLIHKAVGSATMDEIKAAGLGYVDTDSDPSPKPGARRLRRYWTRGKGALKIKWGVDGDFKRCVRHLRKYVGPGAEGLCNVYHVSAVGAPPGKGHKSLRQALLPLGNDLGLLIEGLPATFTVEGGTAIKAVDEGAFIDAGSVAPSHVLATGDKFKVVGSDAVAYPAHVIDLKAIGNLANELAVDGSMSHASGVLAPSLEEPVTLLVEGAGPNPVTLSLNDMEAKQLTSTSALAGVEGFEFDASSLLVVVPGAESFGEVRLGASVKSAGSHTVHNTLILHRMTNEQFSELVSATGHAPGQGPHLGKSEMIADIETKNLVVESNMFRLENLFLSKKLFEGWEHVESKSGSSYDVGFNVLTNRWEAHDGENFNNVVASADDEVAVYKMLNGM